jgi:hypothetical protein
MGPPILPKLLACVARKQDIDVADLEVWFADQALVCSTQRKAVALRWRNTEAVNHQLTAISAKVAPIWDRGYSRKSTVPLLIGAKNGETNETED